MDNHLELVGLDDRQLDFFFFSSRRRHTRLQGDWSSDVCSSDLGLESLQRQAPGERMKGTPDNTVILHWNECQTAWMELPWRDWVRFQGHGRGGTKIGRASCRERV